MAKLERGVELVARKQRRMTVLFANNIIYFASVSCFQFSFKLSLSFRSGSRRAWLHAALFR